MKYASVCSGIEAMTVAASGMGWTPVFFSEIDPFPCAVLSHRFPGVINLGDMTQIKGEDYAGTVDLLAGGTPCQSFSVAGNRKGLDDPRGSLMLHFVRLAFETGARWVVWENVPGVLSQDGGNAFAALLSCLSGRHIEAPGKGWRNSGVCTGGHDTYGAAWRTLDAQYIRVDGYARAVPQRRRRVWVVGHLGDWRRAAEVLFVGEGLSRNPPPRLKTREETASRTGGNPCEAEPTCMNFEMFDVGGGVSPNLLKDRACDTFLNVRTASGRDVFPTLSAGSYKGFMGDLEAFNGNYFVLNDQGGETMSVTDGVTATLKAGTRHHEPVVMSTGQANAAVSEGASPSLSCDHEAPIVIHGAQDPCVSQDVSNGVGTNNGLENAVFDHAHGKEIDVGMTVAGGHEGRVTDMTHLVCSTHSYKETPIAQTITGDHENRPNGTMHLVKAAAVQRVRRLTPKECERLMGFPDGWTMIPWRGKPAGECPDSLRYKACGNSWAVNCARWVMMRIAAVDGVYKRKAGTV